MLSVFEATAGDDAPAYTLWSISTSSDTYDVSILSSDGRLFQNAIKRFKKPASRGESEHEYCSLLSDVFESHDLSRFDLEFSVSPSCSLKVKQKIQGTHTTTILVKVPLVQATQENFGTECQKFMRQMAEKMQENSQAVKEISKLNKDLNITVANQCKDIQEMTAHKDRMQDEMLRKMCLVLNGPKRKIRDLEEQVKDLQRRNLLTDEEPTTNSLPTKHEDAADDCHSNHNKNGDNDNNNDASATVTKKKTKSKIAAAATRPATKATPKSSTQATSATATNINSGGGGGDSSSSVAATMLCSMTSANEQQSSQYSQQVFVDGNGINDYLTSQTSQSQSFVRASRSANAATVATTQSLNSQQVPSQSQTHSSQDRNRKSSRNKRLLDSDSDDSYDDKIDHPMPPPQPNTTINGNTFEGVLPSQSQSQSQLPTQNRNELLDSPSALDFM